MINPDRAVPPSVLEQEPPPVPPEALALHGARLLDPATAVRLPGAPAPRSTAYVADTLLVRAGADAERAVAALADVAKAAGLELEVDPRQARLEERVRDLLGDRARRFARAVRFRVPEQGRTPVTPPDAWALLQTLRAQAPEAAKGVGLEHLMGVAPLWSPHPFWSPQPLWSPHPTAEYAAPGTGGRAPVALVQSPPARRADAALSGRRPVVFVPDTGCGLHPWLEGGVVDREPMCLGDRIGLTDPASDPEVHPVRLSPLTGELDPVAGHGTFISGLVHQVCPDAEILTARVVQGDGYVPEGVVLHVLEQVWTLAALHRAGLADGRPVDVVSLSVGYYPEAADLAAGAALHEVILALTDLGVAVIVAAGNDATSRPMVPASFAAAPSGALPVVSVGALNPDGAVALFSNSGSWVRAWAPGAALVSTFPASFDGSANASQALPDRSAGRDRATMDTDRYGAASGSPKSASRQGGFGTWSGTSFAGPVLAARIAQALLDGTGGAGLPGTESADAGIARAEVGLKVGLGESG